MRAQSRAATAEPISSQLRGDGHRWRVKTRPWGPLTIRILRVLVHDLA